jgi:hypothetical protein
MESVALKEDLTRREAIFYLEDVIKNTEGSVIGDNECCPLKHTFADGIYVREIRIPAGKCLTGKIHKHSHPNFLLSGIVDVFTEANGYERLEGPLSMISPPGTKRALITITDCIWVTVHLNPTNTQDLDELEEIVIAKDYDEYENFRKKISFVKRLKEGFIKLLKL